MARVLRQLDRAEFQPSWMGFRYPDGAPPNRALLERAGGDVQHRTVPRGQPGLDPKLLLPIRENLREFGADLVHVHNWSTSLYGILGARLAGVPAVVYGVGGKEHNDGPTRRQRQVSQTLAPLVDRFTTVCGFLADEISDAWAVPREQIVVIPTGIELVDHGPDSRSAARRALGIPEHAVVVGTTGADRAVKRLQDVFHAGVRAAQADPRVHVLWIGELDGGRALSGEHAHSLQAAARQAGVAERCHAVGRREDAAHLAAAYDVFLNASEFEGTSNAILEAMSAGAAVVATEVGGTPELLGGGAFGRLVPARSPQALADATLRLVEDDDLRRKLGEEARTRVRSRHSNDAMAAAYRKLYFETARSRRPMSTRLARAALRAVRALRLRTP